MIFNLSKDFIKELIDKTDIINVISSYIKLTKRGINYFALCPFHKEKTPSFFVNSNKKRFYCFGCNINGDIIKFLMKYNNITFVDSITILAKNNNFVLEEKVEDVNKLNKANKFYEFMEFVSNIYFKNLLEKLNYKNEISDYINIRNIDRETIKKFKIGYSSGNINKIFINAYDDKKLREKLIYSGLIVKKKNYYYERFKNRVIFPIKNQFGNIVGFSGRTLNDEIKPKYINSSESFFFSKGKELFGLYELKKKNIIFDQILIVEGFLDVIKLHKFGIENVVATMGTTLTNEHIKKLINISKEIIFCFDNDVAGKNATLRSFELFLTYINKNITIGFLILDEKHDPDSYIEKNGKQKFLDCLYKSIGFIEFFFYRCLKNNNFLSMRDKLNFSLEVSKLFDKINDDFVKHIINNHYFYLFKLLNKNIFDFNVMYKQKDINQIELVYIACNLLFKNNNLVKNIDNEYYLSLINSRETNLLFNLIVSLKNNSNINAIEIRKKIIINLGLEKNILLNSNYNINHNSLEEKLIFVIDLIFINNLNNILHKIIIKSEFEYLSKSDINFLNKFIFLKNM